MNHLGATRNDVVDQCPASSDVILVDVMFAASMTQSHKAEHTVGVVELNSAPIAKRGYGRIEQRHEFTRHLAPLRRDIELSLGAQRCTSVRE